MMIKLKTLENMKMLQNKNFWNLFQNQMKEKIQMKLKKKISIEI